MFGLRNPGIYAASVARIEKGRLSGLGKAEETKATAHQTMVRENKLGWRGDASPFNTTGRACRRH